METLDSTIANGKERETRILPLRQAYWKSKLVGASSRIEILPDYTEVGETSDAWDKLSTRANLETHRLMLKISRGSPLAAYIVSLAGVNVLLWRYTGHTDLTVSSPWKGPANTGAWVPLRTEIRPEVKVRELFEAVRQTTIAAYQHQQSDTAAFLAPANIVVFSPDVHALPAFDASAELAFSFICSPDAFGVDIHYRPTRFSRRRIESLAVHLQTALAWMLAYTEETVAQISIIPLDEHEWLLNNSRGPERRYPVESTLDRLFEEQAAKTPAGIAARHRDQGITYRALDEISGRLAGFLVQVLDVRSGFVGVLDDRGVDSLISILGILKTGAAFLPLDPSYPEERIRYMVDNSEIRLLITRSCHFEKLRAGDLGKVEAVLLLDDDGERKDFSPPASCRFRVFSRRSFTGHPIMTPAPGASSRAACMLYTSGSTGLPKGAIVRHDGTVNHIFAEYDEVKFHPGTRFLQSAASSSDISVWQFLASVLIGGTTVIVDFETVCDAKALFDSLRRERVTLIELVPTLLQELLQHAALLDPESRRLPDLEHAIVCGESVPLPLVNQWFALYPGIPLTNAYGPTEASDDVAQHLMTRGIDRRQRSVCIGKPIPNMSVYVLSPGLELQPIGVPGEICVAGIGVGAGYWRNEEKTRSAFVANPFSIGPRDQMLYRTGDLGRWLPQGELEFLGRMDGQVKIRGFRVELGEVEAVIALHADVEQCVVLLRKEPAGELAAYVVLKPGVGISSAALADFAAANLPGYMRPAAYVFLPELPLSPSGKVDRQALALLAADDRHDLLEGRPAGTPVEKLLETIWQSVLKIEGLIPTNRNFFQIGGHSLIAARVASRIRSAFGIELPLIAIFESPTIEALAGRIEAIQLRAEPGSSARPPIERVSRDAEIPLSLAQERLWFLDQLYPGGIEYNLPGAIRLHGELNFAAFQECLRAIVQRHEILRTAFVLAGGRPVQRIDPLVTFEIPVVDCTALNPAEATREARALIEEFSYRAFDLSRVPLFRLLMVRVAGQEHLFGYALHHIISDRWSLEVLINEFVRCYEAFSRAQPVPLPVLPIQYADYAAWQRRWLPGEELNRQLRYWREQLKGAPAVLELPTDRPRPGVLGHDGAAEEIRLSQDLSAGLIELGRREGMTLFMVLSAAFKALLQRYTHQTDIVVGSGTANRNRGETEGLIGFFVNTLALRTDLSGAPTFLELLKRERRVALDAYAHQDVPFEKLVQELQLQRSLAHSPVFQVMFELQNDLQLGATGRASMPGGLKLQPFGLEQRTAKFELTLLLAETPSGIGGVLEYNTDLFEKETVARMIGHWQRLLAGIMGDPGRRLSELDLLGAEERERLLVGWNNTRRDYPADKCIHQLFEEQVRRSPGATAVEDADRQLSYAELNGRANQLAHLLKKLGVGPEIPVGFLAGRSVEMMVGLLGILKAGGAYVPLDAAYPAERLRFMLQDAGVPVVLADERLADRLPAGDAIVVELSGKNVAQESREDLRTEVSGENLAYIIYTSGSTGTPKGVMVRHRGLANYLNWSVQAYELRNGQGTLVHSSLGFDLTITGLFPPLIVGQKVRLAPEENGIEGFNRAVEEVTDLSLIKITPAHLGALQQRVAPGAAGVLTRRFVIGGEALLAESVEFWRTHGPEVRLVNEYGPTETVVGCCVYEVGRGDKQCGNVPIGRPIDNMQMYVLDEGMLPVPQGVRGEIFIGGEGLARGYLNQPGLTAERFVPHPYARRPGERVYRTGDLARHLGDGNLEYFGRIDQQVKVRGFRIELGEIETVLARCAGVGEAAVVVHETEKGEKQLVAYVVGKGGGAVSNAELKNGLKASLPDYMVPSLFVVLERLPLTAHGKIDRKSLPAPGEARQQMAETFQAPGTPAEELIAAIWRDVLKIERIGVNEDFFELGGHSLLAQQVVLRIQEASGVELPLKSLFEKPTIASLSLMLTQERAQPPVPKIQKLSRVAPQSHLEIDALSDGEVDSLLEKLMAENPEL